MTNLKSLPVAVVGAGPVGLAAAAHLVRYQQPFIVFEAGSEPGAAIRQWGHVTTFSPWRYMVDAAARDLLEGTGWQAPNPDALPTGHDLIDRFVSPLSQHPAIAPHVRYRSRVASVGRKDFDKVRTKGRDQQPFEIRLESGEVIEARAVIDASGTWLHPNPAASGGVPVPGEREHADRINYGIPDVLGRDRSRYAGKRVLVVGSGHSAFNVILDLLTLSEQVPATAIVWAMRRDNLDTVWGGGASDALEARGELGQRARRAVESGRIRVLTPFRLRSIARSGEALNVTGAIRGDETAITVDQMVVCTGFRPGPRDVERGAALDRSVARVHVRARAADRSERTQLRHGSASRRARARARGEGLLRHRDEELRTRADVPAGHRLRAGAIGGGDAGR